MNKKHNLRCKKIVIKIRNSQKLIKSKEFKCHHLIKQALMKNQLNTLIRI